MSAWANRKAAVQAEAKALERREQEAVLADQHAALAEKSEEEVLSELNLPNPDEMQSGDDFSAFMKSSVPSALRNRALRKLWTSDPVLANVDALVDYGEDFTGKNDVVRLVKTVYRVGKGMLPDEDEAVAADADKAEPKAGDVTDEIAAVDGADEMIVVDMDVTDAPIFTETTEIEDAILHPAPRRRMRFRFADSTSSVNTEMETK